MFACSPLLFSFFASAEWDWVLEQSLICDMYAERENIGAYTPSTGTVPTIVLYCRPPRPPSPEKQMLYNSISRAIDSGNWRDLKTCQDIKSRFKRVHQSKSRTPTHV